MICTGAGFSNRTPAPPPNRDPLTPVLATAAPAVCGCRDRLRHHEPAPPRSAAALRWALTSGDCRPFADQPLPRALSSRLSLTPSPP